MTGSVSDPWTRHPALPAQLSQDMDAISTTSYIALPILLLVILSKLFLFLIFRDYFLKTAHVPSLHLLGCTFCTKSVTTAWFPPFRSLLPSPEPSHPPLFYGPTHPCQHSKQPQLWGGSFTFPKAAVWHFSKLEYTNAHLNSGFL